ncbi:MAG TPA: hypothetical protein VNK82_04430 [Terriglobales bacterium]|nr:hypothetical protein [Terriglobales bacterium]
MWRTAHYVHVAIVTGLKHTAANGLGELDIRTLKWIIDRFMLRGLWVSNVAAARAYASYQPTVVINQRKHRPQLSRFVPAVKDFVTRQHEVPGRKDGQTSREQGFWSPKSTDILAIPVEPSDKVFLFSVHEQEKLAASIGRKIDYVCGLEFRHSIQAEANCSLPVS